MGAPCILLLPLVGHEVLVLCTFATLYESLFNLVDVGNRSTRATCNFGGIPQT
jgi:hypothetical protein